MEKYFSILFVTILLYIFYIYSQTMVEGFDRRHFYRGGYRGRGYYSGPRYSDWWYPNYWEYSTPVITEVIREKPRVPDYTPFVTAVMGASFVALLFLAINK